MTANTNDKSSQNTSSERIIVDYSAIYLSELSEISSGIIKCFPKTTFIHAMKILQDIYANYLQFSYLPHVSVKLNVWVSAGMNLEREDGFVGKMLNATISASLYMK